MFILVIKYTDGSIKTIKEVFETEQEAYHWMKMEGDHVLEYSIVPFPKFE